MKKIGIQLLILCMVSIMAFTGCNKNPGPEPKEIIDPADIDDAYAMVFEGTYIDMEDFRFALLGFPASEVEDPITPALDLLLESLIVIHRGRAEGIVLDENEIEQMNRWADDFKSMYSQFGIDASFISNERMAEILSMQIYIDKMKLNLTDTIVIDEAEMESAFLDYQENQKDNYYRSLYKHAYTLERETLEEALRHVEQGNITFDELVEFHSVTFEERGIELSELWQLGLREPEHIKQVAALKEGDISDIYFALGDHYLVVQLETEEIPTENELREIYRSRHIREKANELFAELQEQWRNEANYTVNYPAINALLQ